MCVKDLQRSASREEEEAEPGEEGEESESAPVFLQYPLPYEPSPLMISDLQFGNPYTRGTHTHTLKIKSKIVSETKRHFTQDSDISFCVCFASSLGAEQMKHFHSYVILPPI